MRVGIISIWTLKARDSTPSLTSWESRRLLWDYSEVAFGVRGTCRGETDSKSQETGAM